MLSWLCWRLLRIVVLLWIGRALAMALLRLFYKRQYRQLRRQHEQLLQQKRLRDLYAWRERS